MKPHRPVRLLAAGLAAAISISVAATTAAAAAPTDQSSTIWFDSDADDYRYPITPTSDPETWAATPTPDLVEQLQVPQVDLDAMSTRALIETILNYPYLINYTAYNTPQQGFDAIRATSPAIDALYARADAAQQLYDLYSTATLAHVAASDSIAPLRHSFLELLISQPEILNSATTALRGDIARAAVDKWVEYRHYGEGDYFGTNAVHLLAVRTVMKDDPTFAVNSQDRFAIEEYARTGMYIATSEKSNSQHGIPELASALSETYDLQFGSITESGAQLVGPTHSIMADVGYIDGSPVLTPNGSWVPTLVAQRELTTSEIAATNSYYDSTYPTARRIAQPSARYNCHAYAWNWASTSNEFWINSPSLYISDGSYTLRASPGYADGTPIGVAAGAKVLYVNGDHSGIYNADMTSTRQITSKWGQAGLYQHSQTTTPYPQTTQLRYYTR